MSPENLSFLKKRLIAPDLADGFPIAPDEDTRAAFPRDNLSRHMSVLRRRSRSGGRWHALAIVTGVVLALVMAGVFAR